MIRSTHEEFISGVMEEYQPKKPAKERQQEEQEIFKKVEEAFELEEEEEPIRRTTSFDKDWEPELTKL